MSHELHRYGGELQSGRPARPVREAMAKGARGCCPNCGEGKLFDGFVKTVDACAVCDEEIHHHRADDLPAYLVILIVGHLMVGGFMSLDRVIPLSNWQHLAIWVPLTIIAAIALLRPVKGAVVGLQWALYMHGFGGNDDAMETHPEVD